MILFVDCCSYIIIICVNDMNLVRMLLNYFLVVSEEPLNVIMNKCLQFKYIIINYIILLRKSFIISN